MITRMGIIIIIYDNDEYHNYERDEGDADEEKVEVEEHEMMRLSS